MSVLILAVVISLFFFFFAIFNVVLESSSWWITQYSMLPYPLPFFSIHIVCLCHLSNIRPGASSSAFLSFGSFVWVLPLFVLRFPKCLFICRACFSPLFITIKVHFSVPNFIHISWLYILIVRISVSSFLNFLQLLLLLFTPLRVFHTSVCCWFLSED